MSALLRSLGYLVFGAVVVTTTVLIGVAVELAVVDLRARLRGGAR